MDLSMLNPPQREAVLKTEGPLLILAGAGSGKTRVLTHRIAHLIDELGVYPGNILAITFTNKAAKEMKERVTNLLGRPTDIWVSTFHSSCVRILRREIQKIGYSRDFVIYDAMDQKVVFKECYKELNINDKLYPLAMVQHRISEAKDKMETPAMFIKNADGDFQAETIGKIYKKYQAKLRKNNALDFDDLIFKTVELFEQDPVTLAYYQNKFHYIMVDEYQDTNQVQYKLISMLAEMHENLCVVGDDDRARCSRITVA
ncbi:UvrD-helicase domain-containing protein [Lutibacter sp. B2]|nr:UvrD-helicase domain-containing protein [Lutibacter sp. B2]